uniref:UBX domain-containing protein n=1 Tax=Anisakis simplex TaxID=6269 RepID=A0A0M3JE94_ANISI
LEQEERALIPREVLERKNRELRESAYKNTVIRFKLPDVSRIFEFIGDLLLDKSKEFGLYLALSQQLKNDKNKNLFECSLVPTCTIFVRFRENCEDYVGLFSESLLKSATWEQANAASKQWY